MKSIGIIGASGHGEVVADIAKLNGYEKIVFFDDDANKKNCGSYIVVGNINHAINFNGDLFVAIGNCAIRERVFGLFKSKDRNLATLIHPSSVIANGIKIGEGSVVMAGVVINPNVLIGKGCIINTSSSIDHDCVVGDFSHVSVGAHIAGGVTIGDNCWIGIGSIISNGLSICSKCYLGAGAVVINSLVESGLYVGVPAKIISK